MFYSGALTFCLFLLLLLKLNNSDDAFWAFSIFPITIIALEFFVSRRKYYHNLRQLSLEMQNISLFASKGLMLHHLLIPVLLLFGSLGFLYFYSSLIVTVGLLLILFFCFSMLFENFKSLYTNNLVYENQTHNIFDLIKLTTYFLFTVLILNIHHSYELNILFSSLILAIVSLLFLLFECLRREQLDQIVIIFVAIGGTLSFTISYTLIQTGIINLTEQAIAIFIIYYLYGSILHHKLAGKLTRSLIYEYVIISLLLTTLLFFVE